MTLVSHRYNFIYIKNKKVAGTSVEAFFEKYCVDPKKKIKYTHSTTVKKSKFGIVGNRWTRHKGKWYGHQNAANIKRNLGEKKFDKYFKFCVVRNPWDRMVSLYHWNTRNRNRKRFTQFIKKIHKELRNKTVAPIYLCYDLYSINNKSVCDDYIKFENLEEGIIRVCKKLGITDYNVKELPHFKKNSKKEKTHYREYYNEETKQIVAKLHEEEIKLFGYEF